MHKNINKNKNNIYSKEKKKTKMAAPPGADLEDLTPPGVDLEEYEIFLADHVQHEYRIKQRLLEAEREEVKKKRRLAGIRKLEDSSANWKIPFSRQGRPRRGPQERLQC